MILLDTNIVSEIMRPQPDATVIGWLNRQYTPDLYISSITIAEISFGLGVLPDGQRRQALQQRFERFLKKAFRYRVLGFGEEEARIYGNIMARSRLAGRSMSIPDGQIAAIALNNGCTIATRNSRDFESSGVTLVDPFERG